MNHGKRAITIDEVPLEWCFQPGVKLDFRHFADGYVVTAEDVEAELKRIGHTLAAARDRRGQHPRRRALRPARLRHRAAAAWAARPRCTCSSAACASPAPTAGAGTRRSSTPQKKYAETDDAGLIWEGHKAGRDIGYCHIEKLHNLEALPPIGFTIACFPVKIRGASAGWTRAVAIFGTRPRMHSASLPTMLAKSPHINADVRSNLRAGPDDMTPARGGSIPSIAALASGVTAATTSGPHAIEAGYWAAATVRNRANAAPLAAALSAGSDGRLAFPTATSVTIIKAAYAATGGSPTHCRTRTRSPSVSVLVADQRCRSLATKAGTARRDRVRQRWRPGQSRPGPDG